METTDRVYTLGEAAEVLGISRWTLRDWVGRHEVPHRRRGRVKGVYFTGADLEAILASQARPARPATAPTTAAAVVPVQFAALRRGRRPSGD